MSAMRDTPGRAVDRPYDFGYACIMLCRLILLLPFLCCGALLAVAEDACGRMTVRDVPLNSTAAWKKRVAMLEAGPSSTPVPPLRISDTAVPAVFISGAAFAVGDISPEWRDRIKRAGGRHGVDEALLAAVLRAESNFNPRAVSPKGAKGVMQIMPATGRELGLRDFFDPEANLDAGARYLAHLLREFPTPELAIAAYNAGPDAVRRYGGLPPYEETRLYVARVLAFFKQYRASASHAPNLFRAPGP